jgi:acyl-CoA synthetase (AMP-forming)/AMP-acid ligase II
VPNEPLQFEADFTLRDQIRARAEHPVAAERVFLMQHERRWTYRQFRDESTRVAHFLLQRLGKIDEAHPGHVAMMLDNYLELAALVGGCAISGLTLFGINTGLRGATLAGVLNHSRARVLVADERYRNEIEGVKNELKTIPPENILFLSTSVRRRCRRGLSRVHRARGRRARHAREFPTSRSRRRTT